MPQGPGRASGLHHRAAVDEILDDALVGHGGGVAQLIAFAGDNFLRLLPLLH